MIDDEQLMAAFDTPVEDEEGEGPIVPYDYKKDFWLTLPYHSTEFAEEVEKRWQAHQDQWSTSGIAGVVWLAYRAYHNLGSGDDDPITQLMAAGEQGELLALALPQYRTLVKNQIQLFTKERPAWEPQARTSASMASRQVSGASNLLDYAARRDGVVDRRLAEQTELMMVTGAGYYISGWNPNVGLNSRGWFSDVVAAPWELTHEKVRHYEDATWFIYREFVSRWDEVARLAKDYPEKARQVAEYQPDNTRFASMFCDEKGELQDEFGDRIPTLVVVAKPTKAKEGGRLARVLPGSKIVLFDGEYPYGEDITISRMCAAEFLGTALPYSDSWGVLSAAEAFNAILSMIMSRVDTCGVPNFAVPMGSQLQLSDVAGGNKVWQTTPGAEPKVIDLLAIPPELPAVLELLNGEMTKIVGINSVTQGNPNDNVSSGSMAALLQAMAIEFNSNLERAWVLNLERVGTHKLTIFKKMATMEHAIAVMGEDNRYATQMMKGKDISDVDAVTVKTASALSKTTSGRAALAEKLLDGKHIDAVQYMRVVRTGELESTYAGPINELVVIKGENEKIAKGVMPGVLRSDNHELHIREHHLNDVREDVQITELNQEHIQQHYKQWIELTVNDPDFLAATGQKPLPLAFRMGEMMRIAQDPSGGLLMGAPQQGPGPGSGPSPVEEPGTQEQKDTPGPAPKPPGAEPSSIAPNEPQPAKPAKTPGGESVVQDAPA